MTLADRLRRAFATPAPPGYAGDDAPGLGGGGGIPAAVLIAVTDRAAPGIILTRRTATLRAHGGQVAFPGGRIDPGDAGAEAAALREASEEIGLDPARVAVIGSDRPYATITGYQVVPVVGVIPPDLPLAANPNEVASWFEAPLDYLLDPSNLIERTIMWQGAERRYREVIWRGERIWGATAAMIANLSTRLAWTG